MHDEPVEMELIEADFYPEDSGEYVRIIGKLPAGTAVRKYATVEFHDSGGRTIKVTWARERIETALARWLDYRDQNVVYPPEPHSDMTLVVIDCLRAVLGGDTDGAG